MTARISSTDSTLSTALPGAQLRISCPLPAEYLPPQALLAHVRGGALPDMTRLTDGTFRWLEDRLPLCRLTGNELLRKQELVTSYAGSLEFLRHVAGELVDFLRGVAASQIRLRVQGANGSPSRWNEAIAETHQRLQAHVNYAPAARASILSARLISQPTGTVLTTLQTDLHVRVRNLLVGFINTLAEGARQGIVGLVDWTGSDTCRLVSWSAPVIYQGLYRPDPKGPFREKFLHRLGVSQADLMEARTRRGIPAALAVPPFVRPLLRLIPALLRDEIVTVEGNYIAQRTIEWDAFTSDFQAPIEWNRPSEMLHNDPALLFGPFVLAAWGDQDFAAPETSPLEALSLGYRAGAGALAAVRS